ncbi:Fic family protein [Chromatiaceae bacterium AAb-1]|nr:Fic family protein [Chromatiaceae bacterium AAb-1]
MTPVGYTYLNQHYRLLLPKLNLEVFVDPGIDKEKVVSFGAGKRKLLPASQRIPQTPYEHMHLAIKYQGIRLHFFAAIFRGIDVDEFTKFISSAPQSRYNRVLWFLYEWLTGQQLPMPDLNSGNYIPLFEDAFYYTLKNGQRDKRTRIINNAIGTRDYCPTVRKTPGLAKLSDTDVYETAFSKMQGLGDFLSADMIGRSINYLYTKETRSSTEIEKESPDKLRMQRFLNAIKNVGLFELNKDKLINVQNQIVAERMRATDYRKTEIYVGSTIQRYGFYDEDVHYIGPKPEHVPAMMQGLFEAHENLMLDQAIPPLIHASIISFGEVYIHPFEDGNGRLHRYLIHDVMKQRESKHKFIIPVSAAILKHSSRYDEVLESISKPLLAMLDYEFNEQSQLIVNNDIDYMYRYPDFTEHVKFIYEMMNSAVSSELMEEICLLVIFDQVKLFLNKSEDISNRKLDSIVSMILGNGGTVSKGKRGVVLQAISESVLGQAEQLATELINQVRKQFKIDVAELINRPD